MPSALAIAGLVPAGQFWGTWSVGWAGDAMGVLLVTPILLIVRRKSLPEVIRPIRASWLRRMSIRRQVLSTLEKSGRPSFDVGPLRAYDIIDRENRRT